MIEEVLIKKTLKAGTKVWEEGAVVKAPLPKILEEEAVLGTGTVEIIKKTNPNTEGKLLFVAKKEERPAEITTTTSMQAPTPSFIANKPKPKLKRRKR